MQEQTKPVIFWEPKRADKRRPTGEIITDDYVGKFRTKVAPNTAGAYHYAGENREANIQWDFWGYDVDSINGAIRWVDVVATDYGNKILLFLENPKALHRIQADFDVRNIHDVMNHVCGLGKELEVANVNVSYWVRKQTDKDGNPKTDKKGKVFWAKSLTFRDVPKKFSFEDWKEFSKVNGLEWVKEKRNLEDVWNYTAEINFWLGKLVEVQRWLLSKPQTLPFTWDSQTFNPQNFSEDEIGLAKGLYEKAKARFRFPYKSVSADADSVLEASVKTANAPAQQPTAQTTRTEPGNLDGFPAHETRNYEDNTPDPGDTIPF